MTRPLSTLLGVAVGLLTALVVFAVPHALSLWSSGPMMDQGDHGLKALRWGLWLVAAGLGGLMAGWAAPSARDVAPAFTGFALLEAATIATLIHPAPSPWAGVALLALVPVAWTAGRLGAPDPRWAPPDAGAQGRSSHQTPNHDRPSSQRDRG